MSFPLMQAMQVGEYIQKMCLIEQHGAKKDMTEELNTFQNIAPDCYQLKNLIDYFGSLHKNSTFYKLCCFLTL